MNYPKRREDVAKFKLMRSKHDEVRLDVRSLKFGYAEDGGMYCELRVNGEHGIRDMERFEANDIKWTEEYGPFEVVEVGTDKDGGRWAALRSIGEE